MLRWGATLKDRGNFEMMTAAVFCSLDTDFLVDTVAIQSRRLSGWLALSLV